MRKMICSGNSDSYIIVIRSRSLGWLYLFFVYFYKKLPQIIPNWVSHIFFSKYTNLPLLWLVLFKVYTSKQVVLTWRSIRKTGWGICLLWKCAAFENFFDTKKNGRFSLINRMFLHFWYLEWVACQKHSHSKARLTHEGVQRSLFWLLKMLN